MHVHSSVDWAKSLVSEGVWVWGQQREAFIVPLDVLNVPCSCCKVHMRFSVSWKVSSYNPWLLPANSFVNVELQRLFTWLYSLFLSRKVRVHPCCVLVVNCSCLFHHEEYYLELYCSECWLRGSASFILLSVKWLLWYSNAAGVDQMNSK